MQPFVTVMFRGFNSFRSSLAIAQKRFCASATVAPTHPLVVKGNKAVAAWLGLTTAGIAATILMGGFTRLTRSGLSMTDWDVQGRALPSTPEEWAVEFDKYKATPEFKKIHADMTVEEFKFIYFNEWFHRWMGRGLGLVFAPGLLYFGARGYFTRAMTARMVVALGLGGTQGLIGWWMVRSGLKEETLVHKSDPRVSPYRLMTHLCLAAGLFSHLTWTMLGVMRPAAGPALTLPTNVATSAVAAAARTARIPATFALGVAAVTFLSGALVAGNDAGRAFNTWPKMGDEWRPSEYDRDVEQQGTRALFESTPVVQFNHRMLAYTTLAATGALYAYGGRNQNLPKPAQVACRMPLYAALLQACIGISTLLMYVPTSFGVMHQAGGLMVLGTTVWSTNTLLAIARAIPK